MINTTRSLTANAKPLSRAVNDANSSNDISTQVTNTDYALEITDNSQNHYYPITHGRVVELTDSQTVEDISRLEVIHTKDGNRHVLSGPLFNQEGVSSELVRNYQFVSFRPTASYIPGEVFFINDKEFSAIIADGTPAYQDVFKEDIITTATIDFNNSTVIIGPAPYISMATTPEIQLDDNLNNLTAEDRYNCSNVTVTNSLINCPVRDVPFVLINNKIFNSIKQIIITDEEISKTYSRTFYNNQYSQWIGVWYAEL